jgi:hypothetical protein
VVLWRWNEAIEELAIEFKGEGVFNAFGFEGVCDLEIPPPESKFCKEKGEGGYEEPVHHTGYGSPHRLAPC